MCINNQSVPSAPFIVPPIKLVYLLHVPAAIRNYTLSQAVPHLIGLYLNPDEISYRAPILAGLTGLLIAVRDATAQGVIAASEQPLEPYKDQLLGAFSSGIKATASRRPALEGLLQLVKSPQLLTPEELGFTVLGINELLDTKSTNDLDDLRQVYRPYDAFFGRVLIISTLHFN